MTLAMVPRTELVAPDDEAAAPVAVLCFLPACEAPSLGIATGVLHRSCLS